MRHGKKIVSILSAAVMSAAACSVSACNRTATDADTVYIGTTAVIERAVRGEYNYDMLSSGNSEPPLVAQDTDGTFYPLIAEYFTADSKVWTYTVKEGMTWSDGEPVTAEDLLFTLEYEDAHGGDNLTGEQKKYESAILSQDKRSVTLTLSNANVRELSNMTTFRIMPKHIYEGKTDEEITLSDGRVGCGPYILKKFDREAGTLVYEVNPYYPQTPAVKRLIYQTYSNPDTMYLALKSGTLDTVWAYSQGVPQTYADVLRSEDAVTVVGANVSNLPAVLMFNCASVPFCDPNVRKAVSYALDYETFKTTFGGEGAKIPNRGFVPEGTIGYRPTQTLQTNPAVAAELLARSGYAKAEGESFYRKDGKALRFSLTVRAANAAQLRYAELVKTNLEAFGIGVDLDAVEPNAFNVKTSNLYAGASGVTMQAAVNGLTAAGMGMANGLGSIYVDRRHPVQGGCQVSDEKFYDVLSRMSAAKTLDEYTAAAGKLQDYYADETPLLALYWDESAFAYSVRLSGVTLDATFGINHIRNWFSISKA